MKKTLLNILMLIFALGFIISGVSYILFKIDESNTKKQLDIINDNVEVIITDDLDNEIEEDYNSNLYLMSVNYDKLKSINPDVKGWIVVNGTNINYPFVQGKDNKFYLKHSFDKSSSRAGWVFLDYRSNLLDDKNIVIYAHNMRNKTMFGSLKYVLNDDWLKDVNNHIIKLSTEDENTLWEVFSIYHVKVTSDYIKRDFASDSEYQKFLKLISKRSIYSFDNSVTADDQILTLSTCYSTSQRLVLHAKLIKREKK